MSPGKIAAQCSHAALGAQRVMMERDPATCQRWEMTGEAIIVLRVDSGEHLQQLLALADSKGCLLYTSPSPRDYAASRMPSSA